MPCSALCGATAAAAVGATVGAVAGGFPANAQTTSSETPTLQIVCAVVFYQYICDVPVAI